MRLLIGVLVLLTLFTAAALWQRSSAAAARSMRAAPPENASDPRAESPAGDGWSRVVVGRPSGGEPYRAPAGSAPAGGPRTERTGPVEVPPSPAPPPEPPTRKPPPSPEREADAVVTVAAGKTLSEICREHYGTAPLDLVLAVARHNQLAGPDEIRAGQELRLPPLATVLPKR